MSVLEVFALCIVVLPRKGFYLLSTNSRSTNSVLYFAVHFKTGCLHSKLCFDKENCISKLIVCILYFISAPQIGNELRNAKPSFHHALVFQFLFFVFKTNFLHSKIPIHFALQKHCFVFINWNLKFRNRL